MKDANCCFIQLCGVSGSCLYRGAYWKSMFCHRGYSDRSRLQGRLDSFICRQSEYLWICDGQCRLTFKQPLIHGGEAPGLRMTTSIHEDRRQTTRKRDRKRGETFEDLGRRKVEWKKYPGTLSIFSFLLVRVLDCAAHFT